MDNLINQKIINANGIFGQRFLDSKALFLYCFDALPSISFTNNIDGEKAYKAFRERFHDLIQSEHQYRYYKRKGNKFDSGECVLILKNQIVIEFGQGYCEILHHQEMAVFVTECINLANRFRVRQKRRPLEVNLIVKDNYGLDTRSMEIKRTKLDLDLFYEDEFKEVDAVIQKRLNQKKDKGIVLLHGLPGTGKTTYLRYLIGKIKKRVLFLSPYVAANLLDPDFIDLLIDNPDTILVIEDAENVIVDRRTNSSSAVSSLLNISDGLLADFLNVQLICTFNSSLTMVDEALMRKGRLIAKYEFGRLSISKSQRLSDHLGFSRKIERPMTIAEISNQNEKETSTRQVEVIGFRRSVLEN